jgi:transcription initiation factor IIE alpha subunit
MVIKLTKINKILELLEKENLTSLEISEKLNMKKEILFPKLSRLRRENRIMRTNDKKPYRYRSVNPEILLKQLHEIMDKKMDFKEKPTKQEIKTIKIIEKVIK